MAVTKQYQRVTDVDELLNPENKFLMVSSPLGGEIYGALAAKSATDAKGVSVMETVETPDVIKVDAEGLGLGFFSFVINGDYHILRENVEGRYWYTSSASASIGTTLFTVASLQGAQQQTVSLEDNNVLITCEKTPERSLGFQLYSGNVTIKNPLITELEQGVVSRYTYSYVNFYKEIIIERNVDPVQIDFTYEGVNPVITLSCPTEGAEIFYGFSEDSIDKPYTEPVKIEENGTLYAMAKVGDDESEISELTVALAYTSLKDVVANAKNNEKIYITGNFEVIYQKGLYTIVTDGESNVLLYGAGSKQPVGTKVSFISATGYNSSLYKLIQLNEAEVTEGGEGASYQSYEIKSASEINYTDNLYDEVRVKGASLVNQSTFKWELTFPEDNSTIELYNTFGITIPEGDGYDVAGFVWRNGDVLEIVPYSVEESVAVEKVETPVIKPNKRELTTEDRVSLSCATEDVKIYYTLDGSDPTQDSELYTEPFAVEGDVTVSARAYYGEGEDAIASEIARRQYHVFDPTCNIISADNHEDSDTPYAPHTCTVDNVDYAMVGLHDPAQGINMNNTATRSCYLIQTSENEGYVLKSVDVDFNDNSNNITFTVRGSNKPFYDGTDESKPNNIRTNGVVIGTLSSENPSVEFDRDYKYFAFYPRVNGSVFMNTITLNYREAAPIADAPELTDDLADGFESDAETLTFPALPTHDDWTPWYQVNEGDVFEADAAGTIHEEALDAATLHTIKIWYEHYNGIDKSEAKEYLHLTDPRFTVENNEDQTVINFGNIGEGVKVYFTLNGTTPEIETEEPVENEDPEENENPEESEEPVANEDDENVATRSALQEGEYHITSLADFEETHVITSANPVVKIDAIEGESLPEVKLFTQAAHTEKGVRSRLVISDVNISVPTAVKEIAISEDSEAVYFNMQGVRVADPEKGAYIRVQNGKAEKVMK